MADLYQQLLDSIDTLSDEQAAELLSRLQVKVPKSKVTKEVVKDDNNNEIPACINCGSAAIKKHGVRNGRQRYICKDCGKTFSSSTGKITYKSRLTPEQWKELIRGLVDNLSLNQIAKNIGTSATTVWLNKQKICNILMELYGEQDTFVDIAECDEYYVRTSFKGKRDPRFFIYVLGRMPRHHRTYEQKLDYLEQNGLLEELQKDPERLDMLLGDESYLRGISMDQTCVLTCKDRSGNLYMRPTCLSRPEISDITKELKGRFASDSILVTDSHNAYPTFAYNEKIQHEKIESGKHAKGPFNLGRINGLHSKISKHYSRQNQRLPATKYLDMGFIFFWWLEKNEDLNTTEKVDKLYEIITSYNNKQNITYDKIHDKELSINTKGLVPSKV